MDKLQKRLNEIKRFGMFPHVADAPAGAVTFDKMIVVFLDEAKKRLYQVFFYNTQTDVIHKVG